MQNRTPPWNSYRQVAVRTAPPGQLVLMLFEGAIRFLEQARVGFTREDPLEFNLTISNNVIRAQDITNELNRSLNLRAGGAFAANQRRLYHYMDWRLQESNQYKTQAGIDEIIACLTVLRDAWAAMLRTCNPGGDSAEPRLAFAAASA